jgi:hypothetical protein
VTIVDPRSGVTSFRVTASISAANGDVVIHGQDQGSGSVTNFSAAEYEWFMTIPAEEKDRLVLELLRSLVDGDARARSVLAEWLEARRIRFEAMAF